MTPELARIITLARRRGACVQIVNDEQMEALRGGRYSDQGWHCSPFTSFSLGIDSVARVVWLHETAVDDAYAAGSVVHELGHLHAMEREDVENANEWRWLGWEVAVAREAKIRKAWDLAMKDYGMGDVESDPSIDGDEWGHLTPAQRLLVMRDRIAEAQSWDIVDRRGRARWSRLPRKQDPK